MHACSGCHDHAALSSAASPPAGVCSWPSLQRTQELCWHVRCPAGGQTQAHPTAAICASWGSLGSSPATHCRAAAASCRPAALLLLPPADRFVCGHKTSTLNSARVSLTRVERPACTGLHCSVAHTAMALVCTAIGKSACEATRAYQPSLTRPLARHQAQHVCHLCPVSALPVLCSAASDIRQPALHRTAWEACLSCPQYLSPPHTHQKAQRGP